MSLPPQPPLPKDASDVPVIGVYVPGLGVVAAQGGTISTDAYNVSTAPLVSSGGGGGGSDTQYTDGVAVPAHPTGNVLVFNNAGTMVAVSAALRWPVAEQRSAAALYSLASTTTSGSTQNSGDLVVGPYTELSIDITTTAQAGTSPTIQYFWERKGADNLYYVLWQSSALTVAANTLSISIGAGMTYNQSLGATGRLRWVIGGSATPTWTHSINLQAK